jgi:hypothetical protein
VVDISNIQRGILFHHTDGNFYLGDNSGKVWFGPNAAWLKTHVKSVNSAAPGPIGDVPGDKSSNYGLDMTGIKASTLDGLRTNDPNFLGADLVKDSKPSPETSPPPDQAGEQCPNNPDRPDRCPEPRPEPRSNGVLIYALAGLVAGFFLCVLVKRGEK